MTVTTRICCGLVLFAAAALTAGCGGAQDGAKNEGGPDPQARRDEGGDPTGKRITADDLRKAAEAAGGRLDTPPPAPKARESLAQVKPDVVFVVEEVGAVYKSGFDFIGDLFKKHYGKVVQLTGVVTFNGCGLGRGASIFRKGSSTFDLHLTSLAEPEPWKKVFPGQTVVLRARMVEGSGSDWQIIEAKGLTPAEFTADRLAGEIAADQDAVREKFKEKLLVVTGVVESVTIKEFGHADVQLKTEKPGVTIKCGFLKESNARAFKWEFKAGQSLKVMGRYEGGHYLNWCEMLDRTP